MKTKKVLLIYRSGIARYEFESSYNKYKQYNIYAIIENEIAKNIMTYLYKDVTFITREDLFKGELDNMQFDYIVGNPPYQDGKQKAKNGKKNTQNKIYYKIAKKLLTLLTKNGIMSLITPESVCEQNKKFHIINDNLKIVDYTAGNNFTEGVKIVSWVIDKNYNGPVKVISKNGNVKMFDSPKIIFDFDEVSEEFICILLKMKNTPLEKRMFSRNNVGPTRSDDKTNIYKFLTYKKENDIDIPLYYAKREPYFNNKRKYTIPTTKTYRPGIGFVSDKNYDMNYLNIDCSEEEQKNIDSFIFSDYFINFNKQWKDFKGVGFSESLIYLPKFDKTKKWTNKKVKEFFENLAKDNK
jgi:hypothetical protein